MRLKHKIILLFLGLFLAATVDASALKVTPSSLDFDFAIGKTEEKIVTVENPSSNVALFEAYPDDFLDEIKVDPASFTLNPGEKMVVSVLADFKEEGVYVTALSVVSKPLSQREFSANAGVKIPMEIKVAEKKSDFWLASLSESFGKLFENQRDLVYILSIITLLVLLLLLIRRNKTAKI